jgi:8-oxo-dGTP diphosphatase
LLWHIQRKKLFLVCTPAKPAGFAGVFFHGRGRSEKRHFPQKQDQKENAMNLGAFMNPEFPIFSTTLCYLERDDAYLMLHRIKKQDDYNHDKWIGVGGKFERFESPEDCLLREVKEETGLMLKRFRARGLLTFIWGNMTEFIHLYTADEWTGEMVQGDACREGVLEWVPKDKAAELPIWEGDKIFFRLLNEERPYFSLKLVYEGDTLTQAVLDGKRIV